MRKDFTHGQPCPYCGGKMKVIKKEGYVKWKCPKCFNEEKKKIKVPDTFAF